MRKIVWSILKRVERGLMPRYRVVNRQGVRFLLDNTNWIDMRLLIRGSFEKENISSCMQVIDQHQVDTFLDIGANIGVYSSIIASKCQLQTVLAFEPVERNYNQLCGNLFVNNLSGQVQPIKKALSDQATTTTIHVDPTSTGVSRISLDGAARDTSVFTDAESIELVRLDDAFPMSGKRIMAKIDVEGHEMEALRGMFDTLSNNKVYLQIESLSDERTVELETFFASLGYNNLGAMGGDCRFSNFE